MKRGSRIGRILSFFRDGDKDEITAVFHMLAAEGLIPSAPKRETKQKRAYRKRLNGADRPTSTTKFSDGHTPLTMEAQ